MTVVQRKRSVEMYSDERFVEGLELHLRDLAAYGAGNGSVRLWAVVQTFPVLFLLILTIAGVICSEQPVANKNIAFGMVRLTPFVFYFAAVVPGSFYRHLSPANSLPCLRSHIFSQSLKVQKLSQAGGRVEQNAVSEAGGSVPRGQLIDGFLTDRDHAHLAYTTPISLLYSRGG
ncbi:S-adenosyl-L-methionine-dependentmethyltransferases superfamily protein [Striga asiatica]|uniref:S-adenosyl-L-methionine-dependentmethyltransferases superfamily protein n=1 Tax=Striga asiatica TaxID=4170 RepID=A0A5A7QW03_STRAF|nr:S-adenosyl-L-methionine-dependentmethyltransferases superfamily protein [Striga asiatica]